MYDMNNGEYIMYIYIYIIKMMYITFTHIRPLAQYHVNSLLTKTPHVYLMENRTGGRWAKAF